MHTNRSRCGRFRLLSALTVYSSPLMAQPQVALDVHVTLADAASAPIAGAPVRMVLGAAAGWQGASAGTRFVTDAKGEYRFTTSAPLETRQRKMPTNFFTQLVASKQTVRHLTIGVELPFVKHQWLYVTGVDYFPDGTTVVEPLQIFGIDTRGAFTQPGSQQDGMWTLPDFPGVVVPPGYAIARCTIAPDKSGAQWSATLSITRQRAPVIR